MTCRVHYIDPHGKPGTKDVTAPKENARAVFLHLFPDCRVQRVVQVGQPTRCTPRVGSVALGADHWNARGKEARHHGQPRDLVDGRMTPANRTAFQEGWDEQDRYMRPPTEEQLAEGRRNLQRLREWARANL